MNSYEIYVFLLCLIVFLSLTGVFTAMTVGIARLSIRLIRHGADDKKIIDEYRKAKRKKRGTGKAEALFNAIICCAIVVLFVFSVGVNITNEQVTDGVSVFRVVKSDSMSEKNTKNTYLFENDLNDQFCAFDLILTHKLPAEEELQLYDIVIYEVDGVLLAHRIVGIEEPNTQHPTARYFLFQGDAVGSPDRFPVLYEQMKAVYRGVRIPFLGSFVLFLQSPAGYLCILLIVLANIALPLTEKKLEKERQKRLALLQNKKKGGHAAKKTKKGSPIYVFYPVYYTPESTSMGGETPWQNEER